MSSSHGLTLFCKLAVRNLGRNLRRTILTVTTISFGLAIILWVECILEGRNQSIIEKITEGNVGHVQVYDHRFLKDHLLQFTMKSVPQGLDELTKQGAVFTRRIQIPSLISSGENSTTVLFQGIDPESEAKITKIKTFLKSGDYLDQASAENCDQKQILIGKGLSELLSVDVGDKVVMMTQTADGGLGSDAYRVKGIFDSKSPDFDKHNVYGGVACAAALANVQGFHEIVVRLPDERKSQEVQSKFQKIAGPEYQVTTWREALPNMAAMVKFNHATFALLSIILFTVVSLGIINTLLMSVFERTREFGVMLALGTSPRQLSLLITLESFFLGLLSAAIATVIGLIVLMYHSKYGFDLTPLLGEPHGVNGFFLDMRVYPIIQFHSYLRSVAVTLLIVLLAALYPAYRASKLSPVESLRHT